jgi:large conductance mechanosensitive channel
MLKEFKEFLLRGNVVDLAVGIVIGAAFGLMVSSFVTDLITPILAIPGSTDFSSYAWHLGGGTFLWGDFLNAVLVFIVTAAAIFFFVVKPVTKLMALRKTEPEVASTTKQCRECLSSIPSEARRCAFCTSEQAAV